MNSSTKSLRAAISVALVFICSTVTVRAATAAGAQSRASITPFGFGIDVWSAAARLAHTALVNRRFNTSAQSGSGCGPNSSDASDCPRIVTLDFPGATDTSLGSINDSGTLTGDALDSTLTSSGFLREPDGTFVTIQAPGAGHGVLPGAGPLGTFLWVINNAGNVAGLVLDQSGVGHGFLRTRDGRITEFDAPGAGDGIGQGTSGFNINIEDTIAGQYTDNANVVHGFLRFSNGRIETFDYPGAGTGPYQGTLVTSFDGLTSQGDILGGYLDDTNLLHGLIRFHDGTFLPFDSPGAGTGSGQGTNPSGMNESLEVAGKYVDQNNVQHGFIRFATGTFELFDVPGAGTAAGQGTNPVNINAEGDIVGNYVDTSGTTRGFLRYHSGQITTFDLPNAVGGLFPNYNNRRNAIVGLYFDATGNLHGFLRTP